LILKEERMKTRSQHKSLMKPSTSMASVIIQRNYRNYLNNRYKHLKNNDDLDAITQTPIKLIPKNKILDLDEYGCDGTQLINWFGRSSFNNEFVYPQNQKPLSKDNIIKCLDFGFNYSKELKNKNEHIDFCLNLYDMLNKLLNKK